MTRSLVGRKWCSPTVRAFCKSIGGKSPSAVVEKVCKRIVHERGKIEPPLQTKNFEYAQLKGIPVSEGVITCDGLLSVEGDHFMIHLKRAASPERKSFTVCHELCHAEILTQLRASPTSNLACNMWQNSGSREEERFADVFAANLLMPKAMFLPRALDLPPSIESLRQLASTFRTSLEATAFRIVELDAWTCGIIWLQPQLYVNGWTGVHVGRYIYSEGFVDPIGRQRYLDWTFDFVDRACQQHAIVTHEARFRDWSGVTRDVKFQCVGHEIAGTKRVLAVLTQPVS